MAASASGCICWRADIHGTCCVQTSCFPSATCRSCEIAVCSGPGRLCGSCYHHHRRAYCRRASIAIIVPVPLAAEDSVPDTRQFHHCGAGSWDTALPGLFWSCGALLPLASGTAFSALGECEGTFTGLCYLSCL